MSGISNFEEEMIRDIERNEKIDKNVYYKAKISSVRLAQDLGVSDDDIEEAFNIRLMPKDKIRNHKK